MKLLELHSSLKRPLILDGAMGSYLQMKGMNFSDSLWSTSANIENPKLVEGIHKEYIDAGAEIITTNTFRSNPAAINMSRSKHNSNDLVRESVKIAKTAISDSGIVLAGCNAPAEDCYQNKRKLGSKELRSNHEKHIEFLYDAGVDVIWNETFSHKDEIEIVSDFCLYNNIPYTLNLFITTDLRILSGEEVINIIEYISDKNPVCIGINCVSPETYNIFAQRYSMKTKWGFYLNCGGGSFTDISISTGVSPINYKSFVKHYLSDNPFFIGSCCGSTPEHTKKLKELILEVY